jgi:hypothetical protein
VNIPEPIWYLLLATGMVAVIWLGSRAIFNSYFKAKEEFVDRLVHKQKGQPNGEE